MRFDMFRSAYDGLNRVVSDRVSVDFSDDVGLTKQSFRDECDINNIMAKYRATGLVRVRSSYVRGEYLDLASMPDYHTSMNKVIEAKAAFDALPASLRKRFDNDPANFLDFVNNPDNLDEMLSLGMAVKRPSSEANKPSATPPAKEADKPPAS